MAAAFKIPLSSVIFTSAASAANPAVEDGGTELTTGKPDNLGKKTQTDLPNYGMYLKMEDNSATFTPTGLEYDSSGGNLTVTFDDGVAGRYVVVQAFKQGSATGEDKCYAAAGVIVDGDSPVKIDVGNWNLGSDEERAKYTFKVWMEYTPEGRLAHATNPYTFDVNGKEITDKEEAASSPRLFAMKDELHTSWGDLGALDPGVRDKVIQGQDQSGGSGNTVCGENPTNQKIYFGEYPTGKTDADGKAETSPLEFWIAGRECDKCGSVDPDGEVMTLYQAVSAGTHDFNEVWNAEYDGKSEVSVSINAKGDPYQLKDGVAEYNGGYKAVSDNAVYQYRPRGTNASWSTKPPATAGIYDVRVYEKGVELKYETTYSTNTTMTVEGDAEVDQFHVSGPTEFVWDGNAHGLNICGISGTGPITPYYRRSGSSDEWTPTEPKEVGSYDVQIAVGNGSVVNGTGERLDDKTWTMKIGYKQYPPSLTPTDETVKGATNGTITVNDAVGGDLEYKLDDDMEYKQAGVNGKTITGLAPGKYYVRYAETDDSFVSAAAEVTIAEGNPVSVTVPKVQTGYTLTANPNTDIGWGDKVTLTFELKSGFYRTEDSAIMLKDAAGNELNVETAAVDGTKLGEMSVTGGDSIYTLTNISSDLTVEVSGVEEDKTGPAVNILIGESTVTCDNFDDVIRFKNFYAGSQSVTIAPTDSPGTGVAAGSTYYYVHQVVDGGSVGLTKDELANVTWTPYSGAFTIEPDCKVVIYAKATDEAGNMSYARTGGLVFYTAIGSNDNRYNNQDTMINEGVSLESNTVMLVTSGGVELKKDEDYIIEDGTLKLTASYVETLAVGTHKIKIEYTPLTTNQSGETMSTVITFEVEPRITDDGTYKNQDTMTEYGVDTKGGTVTMVVVDGETLTKGEDYVINDDDTLTLTDSFIKTLTDGLHWVGIVYNPSTTTGEVSPFSQMALIKFEVEPRINPNDYADMSQDDVQEGIGLKGGTVTEVKVNGQVLTEGVDYIVADGKVKLTDAYIKTLDTGTYTMEISYRPSTTDSNVEAPVQTVTLTFKVASSKAESGGTELGGTELIEVESGGTESRETESVEAESVEVESVEAESVEADTTDEVFADAAADSEQATAIGSQGWTDDDEDGGAGTGGDSDEAESQVEEDAIYSITPDTEYPVDEEESAGAENAKGNQFIIGACVFGLVALSLMAIVIVLWRRKKKD